MSEWKEYKLDELGKIGRGKSKHRPRNDASLYGGIHPFIQTGDVKEAEFYITKYSQTYSELGLAQSKKWKKGTLCITIAANIAETGILGLDACFPDSIIGFIPFEDKSDVRYIKYSFDLIKKHLQSISQGTTQDNLSQDKLLKFYFKAPDVKEQHRIASILSAYDDLIENNNRRIALLEQMAEQIYKEWFVRMRFPGYENTEFEKGVPKEWEVKPISSLCSKITDGTHDTPKPVDEGGVPLITGIHILDGRIDFDSAYKISIDDHTKIKQRSYLEKGDIIFSNIGTIGSIAIVNEDFEYSVKNVIIFKPLTIEYSLFLYYMIKSPSVKEQLLLDSSGTSQKFITLGYIRKVKTVIPEIELIKKYSQLVRPMFEETRNLQQQTQNLKQTRDLLLPRLISGKLKINELKELKSV